MKNNTKEIKKCNYLKQVFMDSKSARNEKTFESDSVTGTRENIVLVA